MTDVGRHLDILDQAMNEDWLRLHGSDLTNISSDPSQNFLRAEAKLLCLSVAVATGRMPVDSC